MFAVHLRRRLALPAVIFCVLALPPRAAGFQNLGPGRVQTWSRASSAARGEEVVGGERGGGGGGGGSSGAPGLVDDMIAVLEAQTKTRRAVWAFGGGGRDAESYLRSSLQRLSLSPAKDNAVVSEWRAAKKSAMRISKMSAADEMGPYLLVVLTGKSEHNYVSLPHRAQLYFAASLRLAFPCFIACPCISLYQV